MTVQLNDVSSGYSTGVINDNFQTIEDWINLNALWRDGLELGQANQMENDLDLNGYALLNVSVNVEDPSSLLTVGDGDSRYINTTGDSMTGGLNVLQPTQDSHPVRKDQFDTEHNERVARENSIEDGYQTGDANLQSQLTGSTPLEASAFSEISWHGQVVENSVTIPDNKNGWSVGPAMSIAAGQTVTIGTGSNWTIVEGNLV